MTVRACRISSPFSFSLPALRGGFGHATYLLFSDIGAIGEQLVIGVVVLVGIALLIPLAFDFVNGYRDAANSVLNIIILGSLFATFRAVP